jgi:teichuronic acid biosynthesis glycosyltransferase TuaH
MPNQKNIVCISNTTWEGYYTKSTVQLLSLLAGTNRVLFVEYPFTWKDMLATLSGKARAPLSRMLGIKPRLVARTTAFNTEVFQLVVPPMIPFAVFRSDLIYNFLLRINSACYARSVRGALKKLQMDEPVCINAYNSIYGNRLLGKLNEKLHVFYCYDGPDTLRYGKRAETADKKLAAAADGLIVTSDYLADAMRHLSPDVTIVKNGVDFNMFNRYAKNKPHKKQRKKIGYIGSIDHRFDLETVEYAVQNLSNYEFEFVGDQMNKCVANQLAKYSNVKFLPPVQANEVPALLYDCDVGLIPYQCNEYTKNIYPLKINEYLSVGVPVVLTSFAFLPDFEHIVTFTKSKEEFCDAIVNEIKTDSKEKISQRTEFAQKTSWENRAIEFEHALQKYLDKKNGSQPG